MTTNSLAITSEKTIPRKSLGSRVRGRLRRLWRQMLTFPRMKPMLYLRQAVRRRFARVIISSFSNLYYDGLDGNPLYENTFWLGVKALKCPLDAWVIQEIMARTSPDIIVETGVHHGGSTLFIASICDLLGKGAVVACDLTLEHVDRRVGEHPRVTLLEGSSTHPETLARIRESCKGRRTMVLLDSCHTEEHVYGELMAYKDLVSPGCYLICEDTTVNGHPVFHSHGPGPFEAVQRFLAEQGDDWVVDRECEKFLLTHNPSGYLLRK